MYITTEKGIFIIYGEIISRQFQNLDKGKITLKTSTPFIDQKGITRKGPYAWVINITNGQTDEINPNSIVYRTLPTHAIVEATPTDDYDGFWFYPNGKQKRQLKLKALFVSKLDTSYQASLTPTGQLDAVEYEPKGSDYIVWWRPDEIPDNHPGITGIYDPRHYGEYDDFDKGAPADPMREDMEFFYENERWSRDP